MYDLLFFNFNNFKFFFVLVFNAIFIHHIIITIIIRKPFCPINRIFHYMKKTKKKTFHIFPSEYSWRTTNRKKKNFKFHTNVRMRYEKSIAVPPIPERIERFFSIRFFILIKNIETRDIACLLYSRYEYVFLYQFQYQCVLP